MKILWTEKYVISPQFQCRFGPTVCQVEHYWLEQKLRFQPSLGISFSFSLLLYFQPQAETTSIHIITITNVSSDSSPKYLQNEDPSPCN